MNVAAVLATLSLAACSETIAHAQDECAEQDGARPAPAEAPDRESKGNPWEFLRRKYDADGDGRIAFTEYGRPREFFERLDRDGSGVLEASDFGQGGRGPQSPEAKRKFAKNRRPDPPEVGVRAPDFTLPVLVLPKEEATATDATERAGGAQERAGASEPEQPRTVTLSTFAETERPVALLFGSYT